MSALGIQLLWCGVQVSLLALLTMIACARPWRIGGSAMPLFGIYGIMWVTCLTFVPLPGWWSLIAHENPSAVPPIRVADSPVELPRKNLVEKVNSERESPLAETQPVPNREGHFSYLVGSLLNSLQRLQDTPVQDTLVRRLSKGVLILFVISLTLGLLRLGLGLGWSYHLRASSRLLNVPRITENLDILKAQLGIRGSIQARESYGLSTAATLGIWKPIILLPRQWRDWSASELNAVLAHEMAHVCHRDMSAQLLSQIGVSFHFYNPLVHWLSSRLRLEQELAADATAASFIGDKDRYVRVLAELALKHHSQFVGWPARTFLPTRQTFVRRLEMLRESKSVPTRNVMRGRLSALMLVGLFGIGVTSLKPPAPVVAGDTLQQIEDSDSPPSNEYDLKYVNQRSKILFLSKPAELLASPWLSFCLKPNSSLLDISTVTNWVQGISIGDVQQLIFSFADEPSSFPRVMTLKLSKPLPLLQTLVTDADVRRSTFSRQVFRLGEHKQPPPGESNPIIGQADGLFIWQPDAQTLVVDTGHNIQRFIEGRSPLYRGVDPKVWENLKDLPIIFQLDGEMARRLVRRGKNELFDSGLKIVDDAERCGFGFHCKDELKVFAWAESADQLGAKNIYKAGVTALGILKEGPLRSLGFSYKTPGVEQYDNLVAIVGRFAKTKRDGNLVTSNFSSSSVQLLACIDKLSRELLSKNSLTQLFIGLENYRCSHSNKLPNSVNNQIKGIDVRKKLDPKGKTKYPYSWRVVILPFVGELKLYEQYRFDEPWDSESNKKVLNQMPAVYRHPSEPPNSIYTSYVVPVGPETLFAPYQQPTFESVTDGLSSTIAIIQSKTTIPWTKPEDILIPSEGPLPCFGGLSYEVFRVMMCDGSIRPVSYKVDENVLRGALTARGGENTSLPYPE